MPLAPRSPRLLLQDRTFYGPRTSGRSLAWTQSGVFLNILKNESYYLRLVSIILVTIVFCYLKLYETDHILVSQGRCREPVTARLASCCSHSIKEINSKIRARVRPVITECMALSRL